MLADVYERTYDISLSKHLDKKCESKLYLALKSLLLPTADFIAWRLHKAIQGWFNDNSTLVCLLGGIDGLVMDAVSNAYEYKYNKPLSKALRDELSGDKYKRAAVAWISALEVPPPLPPFR